MTVDEALKVTNQDIARYLGGLPDEKMHCSVMGKQALEKAIENYRGAPSLEPGAKIICECFGVTDKEIERAIRENNLATVEDVTNYTKAGGGCGNCQDAIAQILERVKAEAKTEVKPKLTNIQKIRLIEETIEREIRPSLKHDGGDIEIIDIIGNRVIVALRGACATCKASNITLKDFVEQRLRELVVPDITVEEASK
ncbi:MAG: Assimilatory nitrate reductase electron transfer subunit [Deltaproteobacteria bacterium ADurb.Bin002]|nr:MAG: Assimilatory nitrate reductase electron transfer subunit [Deltaproteobacteria bacterium ADurb.Bin002]